MLNKNVNSLPELLKMLRREKCYTQEFVAKKLGISRQAYNHYEMGRCMPDIYRLVALCKLYNVPLNTFVTNKFFSSGNILLHELSHEASNYEAFLRFFKAAENNSKYSTLDFTEKQLIFYFKHLPEKTREEILIILYIKYVSNSN